MMQTENEKHGAEWMGTSRQNGSLLVVEDDLALRPVWEYFIAEKCPMIQLKWAISAETAIEMLKTMDNGGPPPYDVIVIDIFLSGGLTGLDVVDHIRASPWQNSCEVILSSSCDPLELRRHVGKSEARTTLLPKPYLASGCMNAVLVALNKLVSRTEKT